MRTAEFAVIGLGSVGSFAFEDLAAQGKDVIGFEAGGVANDRSAVGGDTRLFRRLYREGAAYHELLERSLARWNQIASRVPDAFTPCGAINIVSPDSEAASALSTYGRDFDIPYRVLEPKTLFKKYPQFKYHDDVIAFDDPNGGFVRTDLVVRDAVEQGVLAGGAVVDSEVRSISSDSRSALIVDEHGQRWSVDRIIVATGARSLALLPQLETAASPQRLLMTWFEAREPEQFRPESMPVFTFNREDLHAYGAPSIDGRHVKVAGIIPYRELELSGYDYDPSVTRTELAHCRERIADIVTGLHSTPVRSAVYPDLYTTDKDFILDFADSDNRVFAATGFSGKGFKMCNALGEHSAQVLTGQSELIPEFSLDRFKCRQAQ